MAKNSINTNTGTPNAIVIASINTLYVLLNLSIRPIGDNIINLAAFGKYPEGKKNTTNKILFNNLKTTTL